MMTTIRTAALAATLALASAVPAAATVLNFEFFSDSTKTTLLWGAKIDFGNFRFDTNLSGVTAGITLTHPAAPFNTGAASYGYTSSVRYLAFRVVGITTDSANKEYGYGFDAFCVPVCANGDRPSLFSVFRSNAAADNRELFFQGFRAISITDLTPTPAVIPLPAAGWLLLGGLGALGLMRRRRRA